jgi:glutaminyl-tRNA synthetase
VKGTIHWVAAHSAIDAEVRLFDRLFAVEAPDDVEEGHTFLENLNPNSLKVVTAKCEPALASVGANNHLPTQFPDGIERYQFERMGYFCTDRDSTPEHPVFNRTCTLKDSWAKIK